MKRLFSCLIVLLIAVSAVSAKTYVLASGISNYASANKLVYPAQDAAKFAKTLKKAGAVVTLITTQKATHENIVNAIRRISKLATPDDRVVFFFCGHGTRDSILCYDGPDEEQPMMPFTELVDELNGINAGQKVIFINACHSGAAGPTFGGSTDDWEENIKNTSTVLFLSCRPDESSYEYDKTGAGFFAQAVFNCIHGLCDFNGDHKITFQEIYDYVYEDVVRRSQGKEHPVAVFGPNMMNAVFIKW